MYFRDKLKIGTDYYLTFLTEFLILFSGIFVYKCASVNFGNTGFSEYALCRRTISFIHPVLLLGFAVGIPRYIAMQSKENEHASDSYFICGMIISVAFSMVVLSIVNLFSRQFAFLLFGFSEMQVYILPMSLLILGLIIHAVCYSYFRGKLSMKKANVMQAINLGIIPLLIYFFSSVPLAIAITGFSCLAVSVFFLILILSKMKLSGLHFKKNSRELFLYGIQRIPGDLALAAFFSLPAFIVSHQAGIIVAGFIAFSISLLNMTGAVFGPFSLMMLPQSVMMIRDNDLKTLRSKTNNILKFTFISTLTGLLLLEIFTREIIFMYLGINQEELIVCVKIVMPGALGFSIFISLRSVLDAFHYRAVNTKNIILSFLIFIGLTTAVYFTGSSYHLVLFAFVFSISFLGFVTFLEYQKILKHGNSLTDGKNS